MRQLDRSRDGPTSTPSATLLLAQAQAWSENLRIEKAPARVCRGSSLPERSVAGRYWRPVTAEAIVQTKGDQVHVLADPRLKPAVLYFPVGVSGFSAASPLACSCPSSSHNGTLPDGIARRGN